MLRRYAYGLVLGSVLLQQLVVRSDVPRSRSCFHGGPLVGDAGMPAQPGRLCPAAAPYVDNANLLGLRLRPSLVCFRYVVDELLQLGFVLHDYHVGESDFAFLGFRFLGRECRLTHTPQRTWRLYFGVSELLSRGPVTGRCCGW